MDAYDFGKFVFECRKEKGFSQTELGELVSVTGKAVSRWERGVGYPDITLLEPLSSALGVTIMELMKSRKNEETDSFQNEVQFLNETIEYLKKQKKIARKKGILVTILILGTMVMGNIIAFKYVDNLIVRTSFVFLLTVTCWSTGFLLRSLINNN